MAEHGSSDEIARVHERVAEIIAAAEQTAERIRQEAEQRLKQRIAEADRAADNRVKAAEDEAGEIVKAAEADATGIGRDAVARAQAEADRIRMEAEELKTKATGEALAIVARAQDTADQTLTEAADAALKTRSEANEKSRDMLRAARATAGEVRTDGFELVGNLRELDESLRSNAERLLRDIQAVHSNMLAQIDRVDPERSSLGGVSPSARERASRAGERALRAVRDDGDDLDVPEFIPRG